MATDPHDRSIFTLCDIIRETSFEIHRYLRSGFNEKIYENALPLGFVRKAFGLNSSNA